MSYQLTVPDDYECHDCNINQGGCRECFCSCPHNHHNHPSAHSHAPAPEHGLDHIGERGQIVTAEEITQGLVTWYPEHRPQGN